MSQLLPLEITTWATFVATCITSKRLKIQYEDRVDRYEIIGPDKNDINWHITIPKSDPRSAAQVDFEDNYKAGANGPIAHEVAAFGSRYRAMVDTTISNVAGTNQAEVNANKEVLVHDKALIDLIGTVPTSSVSHKMWVVDTGRVVGGSGDATFDTTDTALLLIKNPVGSGKSLKLFSRTYGVNVVNVMARFRLFVDPTLTADGTALPIIGARQTMSGRTVASAFKSPGVSSLGSLVDTFVVGQNNSGQVIFENLTVWLEPGHNWIIGVTASSNSRPVDIALKWVEE